MTIFRRFILTLVPILGAAAAAYVYASLSRKCLRNRDKGRQKEALNDWENEGGSVASSEVAAP